MQTVAAAPAYSFDRRKTGPARKARPGKLHWDMVKDIRRWAGRQGVGLTVNEQARVLQLDYPLTTGSLREILLNLSYHDPNYTPGQFDEKFWGQQSLATLLLWNVIRACQNTEAHSR